MTVDGDGGLWLFTLYPCWTCTIFAWLHPAVSVEDSAICVIKRAERGRRSEGREFAGRRMGEVASVRRQRRIKAVLRIAGTLK